MRIKCVQSTVLKQCPSVTWEGTTLWNSILYEIKLFLHNYIDMGIKHSQLGYAFPKETWSKSNPSLHFFQAPSGSIKYKRKHKENPPNRPDIRSIQYIYNYSSSYLYLRGTTASQ